LLAGQQSGDGAGGRCRRVIEHAHRILPESSRYYQKQQGSPLIKVKVAKLA
jgi:hypothetical protein